MKESNIIHRCKQGDRAAQRMLFDQYYNYVYTISHRYVQHHQDTEDVVSITFNKIFKNIHQLRDTADMGVKRWIQTISINESLRALKRKQPIDYTSDDKNLDSSTEIKDSPIEINTQLIKKVVNEMPLGTVIKNN